MSPVKKFAIALLLALVLLFRAPPREAFANYPEQDRRITVIVPFAAGGSNDILVRFIARKMRERAAANACPIDSSTPAIHSNCQNVKQRSTQ